MENTGLNELNEQISSCVAHLMMQHDCVVIPGFGAIIGNYQPARLHPVTHLVQAPSKQLVFNRSLSKDDGLLTGTFALRSGMDFQAARQIIESFVSSVKQELQRGAKINFKGVGVFSNNIEGITVFQADVNTNLLPESFGLGPVQLSLIIREPIPERRPQPEFVNRELTAPAKRSVGSLRKTVLRVAPVFLLGAILSINALLPSGSRVKISDLSFGGISNSVPVEAVAGVQASGLPQARKAIDLPLQDNLFTAENASIYLVAGCYSSRTNADGMVDYLVDKGFDASVLDLTPAGLYRVVYGAYPDISAASEELTQIKKGFNEEAWMLIK